MYIAETSGRHVLDWWYSLDLVIWQYLWQHSISRTLSAIHSRVQIRWGSGLTHTHHSSWRCCLGREHIVVILSTKAWIRFLRSLFLQGDVFIVFCYNLWTLIIILIWILLLMIVIVMILTVCHIYIWIWTTAFKLHKSAFFVVCGLQWNIITTYILFLGQCTQLVMFARLMCLFKFKSHFGLPLIHVRHWDKNL